MKLLAIMGSSKNGNTTELVKYFEKKLNEQLNCEFEYLYLSDHPIDLCIGCHNCIFIGEDKCPQYRNVKSIEDRITESDGVILATPGYMFSVTGIMKNFLDHVAYNCHRPKYFEKTAFLISSCTKFQEKGVFIPMEAWVTAAGFRRMGKLSVDMVPFPLSEEEINKKKAKIDKAANEFCSELKKKQKVSPKLGDLMIFYVFRRMCKIAPNILKADYAYFEVRNAYDKNSSWYFPAKVSFINKKIAGFVEKRMEKSIVKMTDTEKLKNQSSKYKNRLTYR